MIASLLRAPDRGGATLLTANRKWPPSGGNCGHATRPPDQAHTARYRPPPIASAATVAPIQRPDPSGATTALLSRPHPQLSARIRVQEGVRQAKAHLSALMRAAASAECSLITDKGKLVAVIGRPPQDAAEAEDSSPAPNEEAKARSHAAEFRKALLGVPFPIEVDF